MPVPLIYADKPLQVLEQRNAGRAWGELGNVGSIGIQLAENISRQQAELRLRAKTAEDNLAAIEYSNNIQKEIRDLQGLFENDDDPYTIEARASQQIKAIDDKYAPKNPSDRLGIKTKSIFSQEYNNFLNGIQTKKYQLLDSKGKEEYLKAEQLAITNYSATTDPVERKRIKKNLEKIKDSLSQSSDPLWLEKQFIGFDILADEATVETQARLDPVGTLKRLEDGKYNISPAFRDDQISRLKTVSDAYQVDTIVKKAVEIVGNADKDMPYDIEKRYAEVEKLTDNPVLKKQAFLELERIKRVHDQGVKERVDYATGIIGDALLNNANLTINDIKKLPALLKLPEAERNKALIKAQTLIDQRTREERSIKASERAADAAIRSAENQEQTRQDRLKKEQQERYDKIYNGIMGNTETRDRLGTMSNDEFNSLVLDVGDKNQTKLLNERTSQQKNPNYRKISQDRENIIKGVLDSGNITNESDRKLYSDAVRDYMGRDVRDINEMKKLAAEAMQNAVMERRRFRSDVVTIEEPNIVRGKITNQPKPKYKAGDIRTDKNGVEAIYGEDGKWRAK